MTLTRHCVERFAARAAPASAGSAEAQLRELILSHGVPTTRPPRWFHGGAGATRFYIVIDGSYVIPVYDARPRNGALPARPYTAPTFISRDIDERELAALSGEELAHLISLPPKVVRAWAPDDSDPKLAEAALRERLAREGVAGPEPPGWAGRRRPDVDFFYVHLGDALALEVRRSHRDSGVRSRFSATALLDREDISSLRGEELLAALRIEPAALRRYREQAPGIPEDARAHLSQRIVAEGRLAHELPAWVGPSLTWGGLVVVVGDDVALLLRPLNTKDPDGPRWRATGCAVRG